MKMRLLVILLGSCAGSVCGFIRFTQKEIVYQAPVHAPAIELKIVFGRSMHTVYKCLAPGQKEMVTSIFPCLGSVWIKKASLQSTFKQFVINDADRWKFVLCGFARFIVKQEVDGAYALYVEKNEQQKCISQEKIYIE